MKLISILILILIPTGAFAQHVMVKGRILDAESKEGEVAAIIQFIDKAAGKAVAFTSAAEDGSFSQSLRGGKDYHLIVSNMGRKNLEKDFQLGAEDIDLGDFFMENDAAQLDAASVTAQKTLVKMEVDKMTYNVSEDTDSQSSTVLDMLRKVPMVTVDAQDNITVNGSSSFLVTVDGKPNQMLTKNASTVFKMMPASAVKNIEVITNPGVKYDAEGVGGVLNIVTESAGGSGGGSSIADGEFGSINMMAGLRNSNMGGMLTMQRGKFSFSINANAGRSYNNPSEAQTDIMYKQVAPSGIGTSTDYLQSSYTKSKTSGTYGWGDFQMSYEPDSLNLISANAGGFLYRNRNSGLSTQDAFYQGILGTGPSSFTRDNLDKNRFSNYNVGIDWQRSFAGVQGKTFTLSYKGGFNPGRDDNQSIIRPESPLLPSRKNKGTTTSDEHTFQADFTMPVGPSTGSLSTGGKFIYRKNRSDEDLFLRTGPSGEFSLSGEGSVDYTYTNKIAAAYIEYSNTFGKFGIKTGGRYEYTWQDVIYKKGRGEDFSIDYGTFVPTASLQYNLGMTRNIGISYNMRISRPGISYLNPFINNSDPTQISYGNPNLDIAKTHNISLVYNYFSPIIMMNATLTHSIGRDGISSYTFQDGGTLVTTYGNILRDNSTNLNLFANVNLGKTTRIYANASVGHTDISSRTLGYSNSYWGAHAYMGAQETVFWDLRLSENLFLTPKQHTLQGTVSGIQGMAVSITKSFLDDKLSISLTGVSPLSLKKYLSITVKNIGEGYSMASRIKPEMQQMLLSLTWNFGKASSARVKKASRTIHNDEVLENKSSTDAASQGTGVATAGR